MSWGSREAGQDHRPVCQRAELSWRAKHLGSPTGEGERLNGETTRGHRAADDWSLRGRALHRLAGEELDGPLVLRVDLEGFLEEPSRPLEVARQPEPEAGVNQLSSAFLAHLSPPDVMGRSAMVAPVARVLHRPPIERYSSTFFSEKVIPSWRIKTLLPSTLVTMPTGRFHTCWRFLSVSFA